MLKKLAGQTATYGLSSILARLIGNLLLPLQTGRLSLQDFSVLSEALAWAAMLSVLFPLGLETALFRFSNENPLEKERTENKVISFQILCALILGFPALLFFHWRMPQLGGTIHAVILLTLILDSIQGIFLASLRNRQLAGSFLKVRLASVGLSIILNLFFLSGWPVADQLNPIGVNYKLILWINLACSALSFLPMLARMMGFSWKLDREFNRKLLFFSVPMVGISLVGVGNDIMGRIMLQNLCPHNFYPGTDQGNLIGIYSGAAKIAVFINLGIQAYRYAADPFFFSFQERKDTARYMASSFTWFAAAGLLALVAIQGNIELILQIFLRKPEFMLAKDAIFFLLLANLGIGVYYNLSFWYKFSGKTWWGTVISVIGFGLNILLNFLLVPKMGMNGSALAFLCCSVFMCLASWYLGRIAFPVAWEYGKTGLLLAIAIAFCLIPNLLPQDFFWKLTAGIALPSLFAVLIIILQRNQLKRHGH
jgi:O-antigen/teichoic acid export membrane protein